MNAKNQIKTVISFLIIVATVFIIYQYKTEIYFFYRDSIIKETEKISLNKNSYYKEKNYLYIQNTDNFVASSKKDIINIMYTIINSGSTTSKFYCDRKYIECKNDINEVSTSEAILSNINNFVHPYNSFKYITVSYNEYGEITIIVNRTYTNEEITQLNNKAQEIITNNIKNTMTNKEKIKVIHDYIINNSKYQEKDEQHKNSDIATGVLISGYGQCSSYADAMAIFLEMFEINNYKIASENHIWNLVFLNDVPYHLDLTWDDPITEDGSNKLSNLFLLVNDNDLLKIDKEKHNYDKEVYLELKKNS